MKLIIPKQKPSLTGKTEVVISYMNHALNQMVTLDSLSFVIPGCKRNWDVLLTIWLKVLALLEIRKLNTANGIIIGVFLLMMFFR